MSNLSCTHTQSNAGVWTMELTAKQWFQIVSGSISGLITGAALLNPLFGETLALKIVAVLGILNIVLSSVGAATSGQADLVKDVRNMPGVAKVLVNEDANKALATMATDPNEPKVGATSAAAREVLKDTAKG